MHGVALLTRDGCIDIETFVVLSCVQRFESYLLLHPVLGIKGL